MNRPTVKIEIERRHENERRTLVRRLFDRRAHVNANAWLEIGLIAGAMVIIVESIVLWMVLFRRITL